MTATTTLTFADAVAHFEPVLGFEIHVELNTATKMFSQAPNAFGDEPNTNVTEVDLGMPGVLPVVNRTAVESAIKLGLALNCTIAPRSEFARKHYFYPDLPKNFQTSQYEQAIAHDGWVDVELDDGTVFRVEIERAHLEEDAGKLTHMGESGRIHSASYALVDYNRAGVPLIEVVSKPISGAGDRAPELAKVYVQTIREIVRALGISDARMERGNLRCDANVSLMPKDATQFGTRTETKNVNSLRAIGYAVDYEIRRQAAVLSAGDPVVQQTRHWQEDTRTTTPGRTKSDADDYRYFPEPDLVPIEVDQAWLDRLAAQLPELPVERRRRLKTEWGLSDAVFRDMVNADALDVVEQTITAGASPGAASKWWMGEIARLAHAADVAVTELGITPHHVVELETLTTAGTINDRLARQVLGHVADGEGSPAEVVEARSLAVVSDDAALTAAIDTAIASNPDVVAKVQAGKTQAIGALIGPVMQATGGKADAGRVRQLLAEKLGLQA
ncbi:Asp-tRNA(Asn)/Glu-tRNA(Gln) amidotransferase subunit GatB [Enteractinococcus coprophilus]|uniref:Aspartyl/glutamyl-tRNA(Asn/Gln) amidotransferase subunit B n=1 Tax=Enteractinococcus coprophilus TaxID=1027633 RepID=A0A543AG57_9MICC|nr:Asp-tRNA(Asn)/Glu-tRNA(Gln) amidotransferase subunit GatB [Enteractinococcus coprophilus]TQL71563.1 aspartyl/glutamyl-tRNA(Asn/Gln) amidotransferase subunit B [Enteractinococcus coprophilus]